MSRKLVSTAAVSGAAAAASTASSSWRRVRPAMIAADMETFALAAALVPPPRPARPPARILQPYLKSAALCGPPSVSGPRRPPSSARSSVPWQLPPLPPEGDGVAPHAAQAAAGRRAALPPPASGPPAARERGPGTDGRGRGHVAPGPRGRPAASPRPPRRPVGPRTPDPEPWTPNLGPRTSDLGSRTLGLRRLTGITWIGHLDLLCAALLDVSRRVGALAAADRGARRPREKERRVICFNLRGGGAVKRAPDAARAHAPSAGGGEAARASGGWGEKIWVKERTGRGGGERSTYSI